jgi:hypothetical protein
MKNFVTRFSIVLLLVWVAISFISSSEDSDAPTDNSILAYNLAEDCVKQRLKSPSTAEFAGLFEKKDHVTKIGSDKYKIRSYVDAQNSFGATIRNQWSCTITLYNDGDSYQCENVIVD